MGDCVFRGTATRSGEVSTCNVIIPKSVGHRSVWEPGIPGLEPMATDFKILPCRCNSLHDSASYMTNILEVIIFRPNGYEMSSRGTFLLKLSKHHSQTTWPIFRLASPVRSIEMLGRNYSKGNLMFRFNERIDSCIGLWERSYCMVRYPCLHDTSKRDELLHQ
jgi:hypothetical protein